jgi:hypothetical protein
LNRRLVVQAGLPLAKALHSFAHETRHAAQTDADLGCAGTDESFHPVNFLLRTRLREMDADAFAVFFLANHAKETDSRHFFDLRNPVSVASGMFAASSGTLDRSAMYRAFLDAWQENGKDAALSMRAAAAALFADGRVNRAYDRDAVQQWKDVIWPEITGRAKKPRSDRAQSLRAVFQKFHDKKFMSPEENLVAHAKRYSKLFGAAGSPDYLEGCYDRLFGFLSERAPGSDAVWGGPMRELKDDFNRAVDHYLGEIPDLSQAIARRRDRISQARAARAAA